MLNRTAVIQLKSNSEKFTKKLNYRDISYIRSLSMTWSPISQIMNLCRYEPNMPSTSETSAVQKQSFFEELSFLLAPFKNWHIRPVPDPALMLVLYKDRTRRKKRKVSKKGKPENLYFNRKQHKDPLPDEEDPDDDD